MSDYYVPGIEETDPKKTIMSLQQAHEKTASNADDIATNTADIATNTANIATNTANIATNTANIAANTAAISAKGAPDVIIEDQKSSGTSGGGAVVNANTRTLNTIVRNTISMGALSSNQFPLTAGTYYIAWWAPAWRVDQHNSLLRNTTDSSNAIIGTLSYSASATDNAMSVSEGAGIVTIASTKSFAIWSNCVTARATNGFGPAGGFGTIEVYTRVHIWKLA